MQTKPKLRFKEFNDDWLTTTIGKVSQGNLSYGINAAAKDFDGTNKYIRITDIDEFSNKYLYDNVVSPAGKLDNNFLLKNNDIIFARTGASTGKTYLYNPEDGILYYAGFLIKAHIKDDICAKFIFYCTKLDKYKKWVSITSLRSGQPGINAQEYSNYKFKIPTLLEQEKIAGFLSKVDELINECEGEVKDLEEQKKGLMQKIFSQQIRFKDSNNNPYPDWEEHCINEFIISLKSGLSRELQNEDIGIPVIRANNTYNGIVGGNDIKYWYKKDPKGANIDNYILDDGDILINFINSLPRMGETAIYTNFLNRPCIYTTNLLRLKLNNKLNYKYFFYYTKTSEYINYIKAITKPAVNQASFTTVDFKNLKLLLPCLEEQEKIAKVLSKMNELIEEKKALLSDWQRFKKGLLQQMFV